MFFFIETKKTCTRRSVFSRVLFRDIIRLINRELQLLNRRLFVLLLKLYFKPQAASILFFEKDRYIQLN